MKLKKDFFYPSNLFQLFFVFISVVSFTVVVLRSYFVPLCHDEAATFFFFIQSGNYMPFYSQVDANNHILNSFLGNICFHLFGSSPFALRLPNTLSFLLLIVGVYKLNKHIIKVESKFFLTIALLFSFHWLTFFSACRGYGLSMSLLILGIAYMLNYITTLKNKSDLVFSLFLFQLAISSNLILILICLLLSGLIIVVQFFNKKLFNFKTTIIWILFFALIFYWLSFSFFLQKNGALYYGDGDSYWKVTFLTLIKLLIGQPILILKYALVVFFVLVIGLNLFSNAKTLLNPVEFFRKPKISLLFLIILCILILGFYLMHKLLGINYPEDRTGLFYYVFFVLLVAFTFNDFVYNIFTKIILYAISTCIIIHFIFNVNFRKHSLYVYETIPEHFYTTLLNEQAKVNYPITIGGHRVIELFYGFLNYRNNFSLNPCDPTDNLQLCFDYYIASINQKPYWEKYYSVIDSEPDWGFVVLKRKTQIIKKPFYQKNNFVINATHNEFNDLYHNIDTIFTTTNPLLAEVNFDVLEIEKPTNTWLVFSINDSLNNGHHFLRYPLQWSGYDLNNRKGLKCSITLPNLPAKAKNIAVFLWNIEKNRLKIKVNQLTISQIYGEGIELKMP